MTAQLECDWENFQGDDSTIVLTDADVENLYEVRVGNPDPHGGHCFRMDDPGLTLSPVGSLAQAEALLVALDKSRDCVALEADGLLWPLMRRG